MDSGGSSQGQVDEDLADNFGLHTELPCLQLTDNEESEIVNKKCNSTHSPTGHIVVSGTQPVGLVDPLPSGAPHSMTPTPPPQQALAPTLGALLNVNTVNDERSQGRVDDDLANYFDFNTMLSWWQSPNNEGSEVVPKKSNTSRSPTVVMGSGGSSQGQVDEDLADNFGLHTELPCLQFTNNEESEMVNKKGNSTHSPTVVIGNGKSSQGRVEEDPADIFSLNTQLSCLQLTANKGSEVVSKKYNSTHSPTDAACMQNVMSKVCNLNKADKENVYKTGNQPVMNDSPVGMWECSMCSDEFYFLVEPCKNGHRLCYDCNGQRSECLMCQTFKNYMSIPIDTQHLKNEGWCPLCLSKGIHMKTSFYQVNLNEAMLLCDDMKCPFPLIGPCGYTHINRNFMEMPKMEEVAVSVPVEKSNCEVENIIISSPPETTSKVPSTDPEECVVPLEKLLLTSEEDCYLSDSELECAIQKLTEDTVSDVTQSPVGNDSSCKPSMTECMTAMGPFVFKPKPCEEPPRRKKKRNLSRIYGKVKRKKKPRYIKKSKMLKARAVEAVIP